MFKQVKKQEITKFGLLGKNYFKHLIESELKNNKKEKSLLNKILGIFKINIEGGDENYYILMEN
jgi:hypothetical protein